MLLQVLTYILKNVGNLLNVLLDVSIHYLNMLGNFTINPIVTTSCEKLNKDIFTAFKGF